MSYIPANIPITVRLQYGLSAVKIPPHYSSFVTVTIIRDSRSHYGSNTDPLWAHYGTTRYMIRTRIHTSSPYWVPKCVLVPSLHRSKQIWARQAQIQKRRESSAIKNPKFIDTIRPYETPRKQINCSQQSNYVATQRGKSARGKYLLVPQV